MPPRMRRRITSARREQIEKEQEELSHAIVRPFETLLGLPVSYNQPPVYEEVLKHPLTTKDSAVLYTSLMRSRYNYLHRPPMFKLYWVKQSSYNKKGEDKEKDKVVVKREYGKKLTKEKDADSRIPVLSSDISARDAMVKLCDGGITLGPHFFQVRFFIVKDERSAKRKKGEEEDKEKVLEVNTYAPKDASPEKETTPKPDQPKEIKDKETKDTTETPKELASPSKRKEKKKAKESKGKEKVEKSVDKEKSDKEKSDKEKSDKEKSDKEKPDTNDAEKDESRPSPPGPAPRATIDMQSIDNTIMISNLNAIARQEQSLNVLMKTVASGKASQQQITVFKGYIERARAMGPQPHHAYLFPNGQLPFIVQQNQRNKYRPAPRERKLTAFQEKYLNDATILFEFAENSNIRFSLPEYAICEVTDASPDNITERPEDEDEDEETKDIIMSFIWIHNIDEVEEYEEKLAKYEKIKKEKEEKEEEERKKEEQKKNEEEQQKEEGAAENEQDAKVEEIKVEPDVEARRLPTRGGKKKKKAPPPRKERPFEPPVEPEVKYTTMSITLHHIPSRYVPIIVNSVKPEEEVRKKMEKILATGTRFNSFYLWYQVDGKLDENLAEDLRAGLVQEEKKMPGVLLVAEALEKKRKMKERAEKAAARAKRVKLAKMNAEAEQATVKKEI